MFGAILGLGLQGFYVVSNLPSHHTPQSLSGASGNAKPGAMVRRRVLRAGMITLQAGAEGGDTGQAGGDRASWQTRPECPRRPLGSPGSHEGLPPNM